jgi:transposase
MSDHGNPEKHRAAWTSEQDAQLIELAPTHTYAQIAGIAGRTTDAVIYRSKQIGAVRTRHVILSDADRQAICEQHALGVGQHAIARMIGRDYKTVAKEIKRLALPPAPAKAKRKASKEATARWTGDAIAYFRELWETWPERKEILGRMNARFGDGVFAEASLVRMATNLGLKRPPRQEWKISDAWRPQVVERLRELKGSGYSHAATAGMLTEEFGARYTAKAVMAKTRKLGIASCTVIVGRPRSKKSKVQAQPKEAETALVTVWTEEVIARFLALRGEHKNNVESAEILSKEFGIELTHGAVAKKAHRMRLPPLPGGRRQQSLSARRDKQKAIDRERYAALKSIAPVMDAIKTVAPTIICKPIVEKTIRCVLPDGPQLGPKLTHFSPVNIPVLRGVRECQWLDGERPFLGCDAPRFGDRPYCIGHCLRAYPRAARYAVAAEAQGCREVTSPEEHDCV